MKEVIVYQMGKVGSTSIVESIKRKGLDVWQSHFLNPETFHEMIDRLSLPFLSEEQVHHMTHQLRHNLVLYNKIQRYRAHEGSIKEKLGLITLVRDPIDWYFSNLIQNLFILEKDIVAWLKIQGKIGVDDGLTTEGVRYFLEEVFSRYMDLVPDMDSDHRMRIKAAATKHGNDEQGQIHRFVYSQVATLLRPHFWLETNVLPVFGVDLMAQPGEKDESHIVDYEGGWFRALLLEFEQLVNSEQIIREFIGVKSFELLRLNESRNKSAASIVNSARREMTFPDGFMERYTSSRYCRVFYPQTGNRP